MRALTALLAMAMPTLILVACSGDQPATTAPSTTPNLLRSSGTYTFSLSCTNAGASTVANVQIHVGSLVGRLPPLSCDGSHAGITGFTSFDYQISVTDGSDAPTNQCANTKPIHSLRPITCGTDPSATLTITPS